VNDKIDDGGYHQCQDNDFDILGIFADLVIELILWYDSMEIPAKDS
jgi:hypothetical protein